MTRKQIRITLQPEFQPEAEAICQALGLRDYSQLLAFLIKLHGNKLTTLWEKK
mgnify:CR=1 FL=1